MARQFVVSCEGAEKWIPNQKDVDGVTYACLQKWDRQLVRFVHNKSLDLRKDKGDARATLHVEFWNELVDLRQRACNELLRSQVEPDDGEGEAPKKKRRVKATPQNAALIPPCVDVNVPAAEHREERVLRLLVEGISTQTLWLEMTVENLNFFRRAIQASPVKTKAKGKEEDEDGNLHD
ncbi:unnamed protein product [Effrenium voratum]|nr:unnamed protein product [Effrenium voratum]CAJ1435427.1 unnamed protein product [Effrenium voratum]